jgi:erythronate-4-phosphate dehydrogenase
MSQLIIVVDENIPNAREYFSSIGDVTCVNGRSLSNKQVLDADILLVRSVTPVNRNLLHGSRVRFVATATIGVDHLDTDYLDAMGIGWSSAPGSNANSVVDYVVSALCRLEGVLASLLAGARVGIIGMGNVGGRLYQRLDGLGIDCRGFDPLIPQNRYPVLTTLSEVLDCEVICCHTPLTADGLHATHHMIDHGVLSQLKQGTVLINAGRGGVIDNEALLKALSARDDLRVVLDVWEGEPAIDADLLALVNYGTAHIAGYSLEGKLAGTEMIYQACCRFLRLADKTGGSVNNDTVQIDMDSRHSLVAGLKDAVLSCYDINDDDQRLRDAYSTGNDGESRAHAFDQLRKNYPIRREFSRCRIGNWQILDENLQARLRALGFDAGKK